MLSIPWVEGSVGHHKSQVEASKEALRLVYGTIQSIKTSGANCLQAGSLPQCYLQDNIPSLLHQPPKRIKGQWIELQPPPIEVDW